MAGSTQVTRLYGLNETSLPDVQVLSLNLVDEIIIHEAAIIGIAQCNRKMAVAYGITDESAMNIMQTLYPDYTIIDRGIPQGVVLHNWDGSSPY